jgi:hypothetical protein
MRIFALLWLLVPLCIKITVSLDVSWIPTDPDGPLPLSARYRDSLRKLCTLIESGQSLPSELTQKRHTLNKMCVKLKSGDNNIKSASGIFNIFSVSSISRVAIAGIVGAGCKYILWDNRRDLTSRLKSLMSKASNGGERQVLQGITDVQIAREARLRRFQRDDSLDQPAMLANTD